MASNANNSMHTLHNKPIKWLYNGRLIHSHKLQRKLKSKPLSALHSDISKSHSTKSIKSLKRHHIDTKHTDSKGSHKSNKLQKIAKNSRRKPKPVTTTPAPLIYTYNAAQYAVPNTYYTSIQLPNVIVETNTTNHNSIVLQCTTHDTDDIVDLQFNIRFAGKVFIEIVVYNQTTQPHSDAYTDDNIANIDTVNTAHIKSITDVSDRAGILIDTALYNHSINRIAAYNHNKHIKSIERINRLEPSKHANRQLKQCITTHDTPIKHSKKHDTVMHIDKPIDPLYKQKLLMLQDIINEQHHKHTYPIMTDETPATPSKLPTTQSIDSIDTVMSETVPIQSPVTEPSTPVTSTQPALLRQQSNTPKSATAATVDTNTVMQTTSTPSPTSPTAKSPSHSNGITHNSNTESTAAVKAEPAEESKQPEYTADELDMIQRATRIKQAMKLAGIEQSTQIQQYLQQQQQQAKLLSKQANNTILTVTEQATVTLRNTDNLTEKNIADNIDTDALIHEHGLGPAPTIDISDFKLPKRCAYHDRTKNRCPITCEDRWLEAERDMPDGELLHALLYKDKIKQLRRAAINSVKQQIKISHRPTTVKHSDNDEIENDHMNVLTITDNGLATTSKKEQRLYEMKAILGDLESTLSPW